MSTLRRRAEPRRAPAARRAVRGPAGCAPVSSGHAPGSVREAHSPGAGGPARSGSGAPPVPGCGPLASRRPSHGGEQRGKRGPRHSSQGPDLVRRAAPSRPICPRLPPNAPLPDALTPRGGASTGRLRGTQTFRPEQAPALASASGAFLREPRSNPDPVRCRPALGVTSLSARAPSLHEGVSSPLRRLCLPSSPPVSPAPGRCPAHSRC